MKIHSWSKAFQAQLARIGAAVDLAVEEHVAGFDAQAVGRRPTAGAQSFVAPGLEQLVAQRCGFGRRHQQFVAKLSAEAQARDDEVVLFHEAEVAQVGDGVGAEQARQNPPARRSLQREDGEGAGSIVAAEAATAAGEQPEALGIEAPDGRVDEHRAVILDQQRVGDLAGHQVVEVARLQALELRLFVELVEAHEGKVEQAGCTPGGEMLLDGAHRVRRSSRPPVATQRTPARRRRTSALATWARRTPAITPSSSNTMITAAVFQSMNPWR